MILDMLAAGGLMTVLFFTALGFGFIWALDLDRCARPVLLWLAGATILGSQVLPATSVFRQQVAQSLGAILFLVALAVPVVAYFAILKRMRGKANPEPDVPVRTGLGLIEDDAELNAEMYAKLQAYNIAEAGLRRDIFSLVHRNSRGEIEGSLRVNIIGRRAEIRTLWLETEARGVGIGSILMRAAEEEARARGCRWMALDTFSWQAAPFYESLGFTCTLTRPIDDGLEEYFYEKAL